MTEDQTYAPESPFSNPCVVHDPILFHGGGERYAAELAQAIDADLYSYRCAADVPGATSVEEFGDPGLTERLMERTPLSGLVLAIQYENFAVPDEHDAVITTGSASLSLVHSPDQRRYHLLHSPPRWLYDRGHGRYDDSFAPVKWIGRCYQHYMRVQYHAAAARADDFVVNSEVIGRRLETYLRRTPTAVIYPPVDTGAYYHGEGEGYLLYVGRLEPHKCVGELVRAVNGTGRRLTVAGTGSQRDKLERIADENVEFLGFVGEQRKRDLLAHCDAVLFNSDHEDFGIVPVEAFASGKPVVGVDEGFTAVQITEGKNGVLFERGVENIRAAIERALTTDWDPQTIRDTAKRYDAREFERRWRALLYGE